MQKTISKIPIYPAKFHLGKKDKIQNPPKIIPEQEHFQYYEKI